MMPGKVNPVLPELVIQAHYQLTGAATVVGMAAASVDLEVTPMGPVVTVEILRGLSQLDAVARLFAERCLAGLRWNRQSVAANLRGSFADAVEMSSTLGYHDAARAKYTDLSRAEPGAPDAALAVDPLMTQSGPSPEARPHQ